MPEDYIPAKPKNINKVHRNKWRKWSNLAGQVFNRTYDYILNNQKIMNHPATVDALKPEEWKTVAWNSAWIAADAVDDAIPGR